MKLDTIHLKLKLAGPLFKRGINRKHRKRNRKKITNHTTASKQLPCFTAMELLRG